MEKKEPDVPAGGMPYEGPLGKVVEGLKNDPILLFGIGAGILVVGVLAFTANVWIVLVVAVLFVAVLAARLRQRAQQPGRRVDNKAVASSFKDSEIGNLDEGDGEVRNRYVGTRATNTRMGNIGAERKPRKPTED